MAVSKLPAVLYPTCTWQPAEALPFGPDVFEESTPARWGAVSALNMHAACASENLYETTRFRTQEHSKQSSGWIFTVVTLSNRVYWVTNWFVSESPSHHCIFGNKQEDTYAFQPVRTVMRVCIKLQTGRRRHCEHPLCTLHVRWPFSLHFIEIVSKDAVLLQLSLLKLCLLRFTVADILKCIQCFFTLI